AAAIAAAQGSSSLDLEFVDGDKKEPVSDVVVSVYIDDRDMVLSTDGEGKASIPFEAEEIRYGIRVSTEVEGFLPASVTWKRRELAEISGEQVVELKRGYSIGGKIESESGKPIKGCKVIVSAMPTRDSEVRTALTNFETRTDNNGEWHCDEAPEKMESVRIRLEHPYYITNQYFDYGGDNRPIGHLKTFEDVIQLKESLNLEGFVLDENGGALKGARVSAGDPNPWSKGRKPTAIANPTGAFSFKDREPGELQITVQADGYSPQAQQVLVEQGMKPLRFLMEPAATIRGRVVDATGDPISGVNVSAQSVLPGNVDDSWRGFTDSEGRFEWDSAPHQPVQFSFYSSEGYGRKSETLGPTAEGEEHTIVLNAPLTVRGTVVDAKTGKPLESFQVIQGIGWDQGPDRPPSWQHRNAQPGSDGKYSISFTQDYPKHYVRIEAEGYLPGVSPPFTSDMGATVHNFELEEGDPLSGTVVDASGIPVLNADVILATQSNGAYIQEGRNERVNSTPSTKTDSDGAFQFPPLEEEFTLVVLSEMGIAQVTKAEFEASNKIQLEKWASLSGTLRVGKETPTGEVVVLNLNREHQPNSPSVYFHYRTETEEGGRFSFDRVVPGDIQVTRQIKLSETPGGGSRWSNANSETVQLRPGESKEIQLGGTGREVKARLVVPATAEREITFDQVQGYLRTHVSMPYTHKEIIAMSTEEREAAAKEVQLWMQSSEGKEAQRNIKSYGFKVLPDGAFTIQDVEPGKYDLNVSVLAPPPEASANAIVSYHFNTVAQYNGEAVIPDATGEEADQPVDLGELKLTLLKTKE
ncbi:MAG: carboxypeptidase regulatory-like domain-containing protein, partial [Candidatus Omnitrophica bacterium]|nr:carboxypeptidase regulatory-like domain-containing protein [Candidatus Omnitrophota bacterium]